MALLTITDLKTVLGISDSSQDAMLNLIINGVSAKIESFLGRPLSRATYTAEVYTVNNRQLLMLRNWPVQSVSAVTSNGLALVQGTDYFLEPWDKSRGDLFRGLGWYGPIYVAGLTMDPIGGYRSITVTYIAGWYTPGMVGYVAGAADSLPYDLNYAALQISAMEYQKNVRQSQGLKAMSEGGLSYTWQDASSSSGGESGIPAEYVGTLNKYREWAFA